MKGLDTNVLVRLLIDDDQQQSALARQAIDERSEADPAFVGLVVIVELVWVLQSTYEVPQTSIHDMLDEIASSPEVIIERREVLMTALAEARTRRADISDAIIAAVAQDAGSTATLTFDKVAAKRIPGMELLA